MAEVVGCGCAPTVRRRRGWRRPGSVFPLEAIIVSTATAPAALPPLSLAELDATPGLVEPDGALGDVPALLARVHESGIEPTLRPRLWLHLLGVVPWRASAVRLATLRAKRAHAYAAALALWAADDEAGALGACAHGSVAKYHRIIAVDVPRTDRALDRWRAPESLAPLRRVLLSACALSSAPGYFQGMNDLAAVLLDALGGDEADAFASFVALLHGKLALSFEDEQRGIWRQAAAVVGALRAIDPPLHAALGAAGAIGDNGECLVLFQPIFLALKREIGTGPKGGRRAHAHGDAAAFAPTTPPHPPTHPPETCPQATTRACAGRGRRGGRRPTRSRLPAARPLAARTAAARTMSSCSSSPFSSCTALRSDPTGKASPA